MRGKCGSDTSLVWIIIRFFRFTFNIILQIVTDPEQVLKAEALLCWHILQLNHKVLQRLKKLLANSKSLVLLAILDVLTAASGLKIQSRIVLIVDWFIVTGISYNFLSQYQNVSTYQSSVPLNKINNLIWKDYNPSFLQLQQSFCYF